MKQLPLPFPSPEPIIIPHITIRLSEHGSLKGRYKAIISPEDSDLSKMGWTYATGYAIHRRVIDGKTKVIRLHRVILERMIGRKLVKGELPDHIDGNPLNNTRENLRLVTRAQNSQNTRISTKNTSGCKGVSWRKTTKRWVAQIWANKQHYKLGEFEDYEEACRVVNEARAKLHGEYARFK